MDWSLKNEMVIKFKKSVLIKVSNLALWKSCKIHAHINNITREMKPLLIIQESGNNIQNMPLYIQF